eukprot:365305-Chlamydomonas_euryale.AAC.15
MHVSCTSIYNPGSKPQSRFVSRDTTSQATFRASHGVHVKTPLALPLRRPGLERPWRQWAVLGLNGHGASGPSWA